MALQISNRDARRLWLHAQGLSKAPTGPLDLAATIHALGFVQLDTIRNVTRAHHHILWSRNQNYREPMLWKHLEDRSLFEHFTHDASVIPMEFYPMWQRQFKRLGEKVRAYKSIQALSTSQIDDIRNCIKEDGPLCTRAFDSHTPRKGEMWARPVHKQVLDYLWYSGELSTSHRENFIKFYDLSTRVIPQGYQNIEHSGAAQIDWLCRAALHRLSFGNPGEIQRFWAAMSAAETKAWKEASPQAYVPVSIQAAAGDYVDALAPPDIEQRLQTAPSPTARLRIINPFDPIVRDRNRLARLFGFQYKNEMFVPAAERVWGYYVYPLLEGDRFVGRMEIKADRKAGSLTVTGFWPEPKIKWTERRFEKLDAELTRLARFIGAKDVNWDRANR